jgi:hypothetical protein
MPKLVITSNQFDLCNQDTFHWKFQLRTAVLSPNGVLNKDVPLPLFLQSRLIFSLQWKDVPPEFVPSWMVLRQTDPCYMYSSLQHNKYCESFISLFLALEQLYKYKLLANTNNGVQSPRNLRYPRPQSPQQVETEKSTA